MATTTFPRSPYEQVGGLVFFGRMLDKIRLHAAGTLPEDYLLGDDDPTWMDGRTTRFLHVDYRKLRERVLAGGTDEEILQWCHAEGRRPGEEEVFIFNAFLCKRGWRDPSSPFLAEVCAGCGFADRPDIVTWFDLQDAEEGRPPKFP